MTKLPECRNCRSTLRSHQQAFFLSNLRDIGEHLRIAYGNHCSWLRRRMSSMMKSPMAGHAQSGSLVEAHGQASALRRFSSKAFTIGAQPSAWTVTILGRLGPIQPSCSISSKAFHIPIRPVPPPVGYTMTSGSRQPNCSASSSPSVFFPSMR